MEEFEFSTEVMKAVRKIRAVMPKNTVYLNEFYDFSSTEKIPSVSVVGTFNLGAVLYVEVARSLGRFPTHVSQSTGYVEALVAYNAGLPLPDDNWYIDHRFDGEADIVALGELFASGRIKVAATKKTVQLVKVVGR